MENNKTEKVETLKTIELTDEVQHFIDITKEMIELYAKKNADYGNAFGETIEKTSLDYLAGVLLVKVNRFANLIKCGRQYIKDESVMDTLRDLGNYSIMGQMVLEDMYAKQRRETEKFAKLVNSSKGEVK